MPKYYLTNTNLANEGRAKWASEQSGLPVHFEPSPMPINALGLGGGQHTFMGYDPSTLVGYGSLFVYKSQDLSDFWRAWKAYPNQPKE